MVEETLPGSTAEKRRFMLKEEFEGSLAVMG
jgi:hypothetical protein